MYYLQQREWQPISQLPLQSLLLKSGFSLVPSLPHPALSVNHKRMKALLWVLGKLHYHGFPVESLKKILCSQMTGWTPLNREGRQACTMPKVALFLLGHCAGKPRTYTHMFMSYLCDT